MKPVACTAAVLAILLAGATAVEGRIKDYRGHNLDVLRLLAYQPWPGRSWDHVLPVDLNLKTDLEQRVLTRPLYSENIRNDLRIASGKRSAVATALTSGRRRRQPTPALGILNDIGSFFDSLRDNVATLAALTPQQRSKLFHNKPSVIHAPSTDGGGSISNSDGNDGSDDSSGSGGGGGSGIRKLHALRPLRPTGNIRSYNRRSFVEADGGYPGANHHDPGLLWTGLGR